MAFHLRYLQDLGVIFLVGQNLAGFVSWTLDLLARVLTFAIFLIIFMSNKNNDNSCISYLVDSRPYPQPFFPLVSEALFALSFSFLSERSFRPC